MLEAFGKNWSKPREGSRGGFFPVREVSGAHQDRGAGDVKAYGTVRSPVHRPAMYSTVRRKGFMDILRLIFSILLPPLGVFLQVGFGGNSS